MGLPFVTEEDFNRQYCHLPQAGGQYLTSNGDGGRDFHLFPKLPAELRLEVWKQAVKNLSFPKVQEFDFDLAYDPNATPQGRAGNGLVACFKPKHNRHLACHRGLLMACIDSREAFLSSGDYHMLPLTYLVGGEVEIEKTIKIRRVGIATFTVKKTTPQTFVRVLLPFSFEHTSFLIDKVAKTFAYKAVHPALLPRGKAFGEAAGLEFVHSIKKLAFSMSFSVGVKSTLFSNLFATSPDQYESDPKSPPYILGALEELSYVSASAVEHQCCIGEDLIWTSVPTMAVQQFQRRNSPPEGWHVVDLHRLHAKLLEQWVRFHLDFQRRWGGTICQKCTCRPR